MIKVNIQTLVAVREPIPKALRGLKDETLRNLQTSLNPVPAEFVDVEYWPETSVSEPIDHQTHRYGDEILTAVPTDKTVEVSKEAVALTQNELDANLATLRADLSDQVEALYVEKLAALKVRSNGVPYSEDEIKTWSRKEKEANAILAGDVSVDISLLTDLVAQSGKDLATKAGEIVLKANFLAKVSGALEGYRDKLLADIAVMLISEGINIKAGWPHQDTEET